MYMSGLNFTYDDTLKSWIDPTTNNVVDKGKLSRLTNNFNTSFNKIVSYNPDATSGELYQNLVSAFKLVEAPKTIETTTAGETKSIREKNIQEKEEKKDRKKAIVTGKIIRGASDRNVIDRLKSLAERTTSEENKKRLAKELGLAEEYDKYSSNKKFFNKYSSKVKEYNKQNLSKQEAYNNILNEIRSDKSFNGYESRIDDLFNYYWSNK